MIVYITGCSKGLGKAFAKVCLDRGDTVIGIGREATIQHKRFQFQQADLRSAQEINALDLSITGKTVMLINNAGIIGSIKRSVTLNDDTDEEVMAVNYLAPVKLCRKLIQEQPTGVNLIIVNISSGAARRSIPGWAAYCSSKAALDRFSETLHLEMQEMGRTVQVLSLAPGIVDTEMQEQIRSAEPNQFSSLETFRSYFETNQLQTPDATATTILNAISQSLFKEVICSIRDVE